MQQGPGPTWRGNVTAPPSLSGPPRHTFQRQPFNAPGDRSFRSNTTISEQSDGSANEVENLLGSIRRPGTNIVPTGAAWSVPRGQRARASHRGTNLRITPYTQIPAHHLEVFAQPSTPRAGGGFRPAS